MSSCGGEEDVMVEGRRSLFRCGRRMSHCGGGKRSSYLEERRGAVAEDGGEWRRGKLLCGEGGWESRRARENKYEKCRRRLQLTSGGGDRREENREAGCAEWLERSFEIDTIPLHVHLTIYIFV
nr:hypothetical protein Iba_chr15fCG6630 [Ipomoea batatas]